MLKNEFLYIITVTQWLNEVNCRTALFKYWLMDWLNIIAQSCTLSLIRVVGILAVLNETRQISMLQLLLLSASDTLRFVDKCCHVWYSGINSFDMLTFYLCSLSALSESHSKPMFFLTHFQRFLFFLPADPHIKVCGKRENVREAKDRIMSVLDTKVLWTALLQWRYTPTYLCVFLLSCSLSQPFQASSVSALLPCCPSDRLHLAVQCTLPIMSQDTNIPMPWMQSLHYRRHCHGNTWNNFPGEHTVAPPGGRQSSMHFEQPDTRATRLA